MTTDYLKRLATLVAGAFVVTLLALVAAARPFDVLTFDWKVAATTSGSAAVLALIKGLAAKFVGDPDTPNLTK